MGGVTPAGADPTYAITSTPPTAATWASPYSHTFTADAPDASWSVAAGTLPDGLALDAVTGSLSGTPTEVGAHDITVQASWSVPTGEHVDFTAVTAGGYTSCGLLDGGEPICWGNDTYGQTTGAPDGPFTAITSAGAHVCGLTTAGDADCWGANNSGQATDQAGPLTSLNAGAYATCAVDGLTDMRCWGDTPATSRPGPFVAASAGFLTCGLAPSGAATCWDLVSAYSYPGPYTDIASEIFTVCGLTLTGAAECWGDNAYGQAQPQAGPFTDLDVGFHHTCALTVTGNAECWGDNTYGQATDQAGPFTDLDLGAYHTCGLRTDGTIDCWGSAFDGESSDQVGPPIMTEVTAEQTFTLTVAAPTITSAPPATGAWGRPYAHTFTASHPNATWAVVGGTLTPGLSLDAGTGLLSGSPTTPAIGDPVVVQASWTTPGAGTTATQTFSIDVWTDPAVTSPAPVDTEIATSYSHQFEASPPGAAWSVIDGVLPTGLGLGPTSGLLDGTTSVLGSSDPITVEARWDNRAVAVVTGQEHTCSLLADGAVDCWGDDTNGQATDQTGPYVALTGGDFHTCGILAADGAVDCWGNDTNGQATDQTGPFTRIYAGSEHTCGILAADGAVDCWGDNTNGQATDQTGPYVDITGGSEHTCGILAADGAVDCWGDNTYGQATDQTGPYVSIAAGWVHTCAVRADSGAVDCWGGNGSGQLGDGTFTSSGGTAVSVVGLSGAVEVTAGSFVSCARLGDGSTACWGSNTWGQLGDGGSTPSPTPLVVAGVTSAIDVTSRDVHVCAVEAADGSVTCWGRNVNGQIDVPEPPALVATQTFAMTVRSIPSVSPVADLTIGEGEVAGPLTFYVSDEDHFPSSLSVSATSDDQVLVPDAALVVAGTGFARSITATPALGQSGSATITVTVTDPDGLSAQTSFLLSVTPASASISGTVVTSGGPVGDVIVAAYEDADGFTPSGYAISGADGSYAITGLDAGTYRIVAVPLSSTGLRLAWQLTGAPTGTPDRSTATGHAIVGPTDAIDAVDLQLTVGAAFTGTVTSAGGPLAGATVRAFVPGATMASATTTTAADGTYAIGGLDTGTYQLLFNPPPGQPLRTEWHDDVTTRTTSTAVGTAVDTTVTVDAHLEGANAVTGTVTSGGSPLEGATVAAFAPGSFVASGTTTSGADGTYQLLALPPGTYDIRFSAPGMTNQWFDGVLSRTAATDVVVTEGSVSTGIDAAMS